MTEKALYEQKNDLIERSETVVNTAKAEQRVLSEEEAAEVESNLEQIRSINKTIELDEQLSDLGGYEKREKGDEKKMNERELNDRKVFNEYVRGLYNERTGELSPASNSAGVLIPTTILNYIITKVYDICPILERSQRFTVNGKLLVPYYPAGADDIEVAFADEFDDLASTSGKFDAVELDGFLAGSLVKVSRSLINNVNFDITDYVVNHMARKVKRFIEKQLLNPSNPTNKIKGLSTLTNKVTAASASAITADDIIRLHDQIKDEFQDNACWIMSSKTRTAVRLLKDEVGRYLFNDDLTGRYNGTILGKPVFVSDNMPEIASGADVIYYGDMNGLATKFSEEPSIEVLREKFATQHAIGVVMWMEFDSKVIDEQQIAKLTMAVSSN